MLRRALATIALVLLGFGGVASARLSAGPAPTATPGPGASPSAPSSTAPAGAAATGTTATTAASTTTAVPASPPGGSTSLLVIRGHGWGHGVGMSQWGADGYALHGWDYRAILAHYYPGTTLATHAAPTVHVLLADGAKTVTLASGSPWKVVDAAGTSTTLAPGPLKVGPRLAVSGRRLVSPLTFSGPEPLRVGKLAYRGRLMLLSDGKRLQVVNVLPLESYLLGVVGGEMPFYWPSAALQAQAVAARSYALAELETVVTARAFDLYADTRSQVYGGIAAESPRVTAAVRATARQVLVYDGQVATTYFSSSSGGKTVPAVDVFGKPIPYLVSVADPYDTLSPNHDWGPVLLDERKVARALKVPGDLVSLDLTPDESQHVARVAAVGTNGTVSLPGTEVRTLLGLRSTWFSVGWLELRPPPAPLPYGGGGSLAGIVRGVDGATLEVRGKDGAWQGVASVSPDSAGAFSVPVSATGTAEYRLATPDVWTAPVRVPVAPAVSASVAAGTVQGSVKPALAGAAVQLQRQDGSGWKTVATSTTDGGGSFAVAAQLSPGSYRVRCAPGHGLSPGVSQPILQT